MGKHKNFKRELTDEDRYNLLFGTSDETEPSGDSDPAVIWGEYKNKFANKIANSSGDYDDETIEEPTSILKPESIDDAEDMSDDEFNDSAEDVISKLGIKRTDEAAPKAESKNAHEPNPSPSENDAHRNAPLPLIRLWFDESMHVIRYTDGVKATAVAVDMMNPDRGSGELIDEAGFMKLYEDVVLASIPTAIMNETRFRMGLLYDITFYPKMPFRFLIDQTHGVVYAYALERGYLNTIKRMYESLKEIGRLNAGCAFMRMLTDPAFNFLNYSKYRNTIWGADAIESNQIACISDEISMMYGRSEQLLMKAISEDPVASKSSSEADIHKLNELEGTILLYRKISVNGMDLTGRMSKSIMSAFMPSIEDEDESEIDVEEDTCDNDNNDEEIPVLAPKDEEERRSIMKVFGQDGESDESEDDDDDDSDEYPEIDETDDLSESLPKDDGDADEFVMDVKP